MGGREEEEGLRVRDFHLKGIDTYALIARILPIVNLPTFQSSSLFCSESLSRLKGIETDWMEGWKDGRLGRHLTDEGIDTRI